MHLSSPGQFLLHAIGRLLRKTFRSLSKSESFMASSLLISLSFSSFFVLSSVNSASLLKEEGNCSGFLDILVSLLGVMKKEVLLNLGRAIPMEDLTTPMSPMAVEMEQRQAFLRA